MKHRQSKHRGSFIIAFVLLALCARVAVLLTLSHPEILDGQFILTEGSDEADYHHLAENLATTGVYRLTADGPPTAKRPPGMILPLAALYKIWKPSPLLALGYVLFCSLLLVPLAGALARQTTPRPEVEWWAMLLAALLPTQIFTSVGLWSEPPTLLFLLLSLWLLMRALFPKGGGSEGAGVRRNAQLLLWMGAGLALGYAYLNRPSAGLVALLIFGKLGMDLLRRKVAWQSLLTFSLLLALPITIWGWRNARLFGEFFVGNTESTAALWGANNRITAGLSTPVPASVNGFDLKEEAAAGHYLGSWVPLNYLTKELPHSDSEMERRRQYQERVRKFVLDHPGAFARLLGYKGIRLLTAEPMPPSILAEGPRKRRLKRIVTFAERWTILFFGGLGLGLLLRRGHDHFWLYSLYAAGGLAVIAIAYVNARIFLPVAMVLLVPTALGLQASFDFLLQRLQARHAEEPRS